MQYLSEPEQQQLHQAMHRRDLRACGEILYPATRRLVARNRFASRHIAGSDEIAQEASCRLQAYVESIVTGGCKDCCDDAFFAGLEAVGRRMVWSACKARLLRPIATELKYRPDRQEAIDARRSIPREPDQEAIDNELWERVASILAEMNATEAAIIRWDIAEMKCPDEKLSRQERADVLGISLATYDKQRAASWRNFRQAFCQPAEPYSDGS